MSSEPPSLPYARDEAPISQPYSAYPAYPVGTLAPAAVIEETKSPEERTSAEEVADPGAALQYWTAKRHKSRKGKEKADDEYSTRAY